MKPSSSCFGLAGLYIQSQCDKMRLHIWSIIGPRKTQLTLREENVKSYLKNYITSGKTTYNTANHNLRQMICHSWYTSCCQFNLAKRLIVTSSKVMKGIDLILIATNSNTDTNTYN